LRNQAMTEDRPKEQETPSPSAAPKPTPRSAWPRILLLLLTMAWLATGVADLAGYGLLGLAPWLELVFPSLACLAAMSCLALRLPWQNVLTITGIMLVLSTAMMMCATISAMPLGHVSFTGHSGPRLWGRLPVSVVLCWVAIFMASRELARLVLFTRRRHRFYGFEIVAFAAVMALVADLNWQPLAVSVKRQWTWLGPESAFCWYSTPWFHFVGWMVTLIVILAFCAPWFISKRPAKAHPRIEPALVWVLVNLHFLMGNAVGRLWPAVLVGGLLVAASVFLAWCGLRASGPAASPVRQTNV
jgi:uncharacterized membrane protein